jgi:hypothetical protein
MDYGFVAVACSIIVLTSYELPNIIMVIYVTLCGGSIFMSSYLRLGSSFLCEMYK